MDWQTVEGILDEFKTHAERVGEAGPYGAAEELGRMLDYVSNTPLLKEYIENCRLGIPESQVEENLREVVSAMGTQTLNLGAGEDSIARLWHIFLLLRGDINAIRQLGYGLSLAQNGHAMIKAFGEKLVLRFYKDVAMHFRRNRKDYEHPAHTPAPEKKTFAYDVFISHASANKSEFVNSLYKELTRLGIDIWYDSDAEVLEWGDRLKKQIGKGLETCRFGIVVLSPEFFGREWPERELNALLPRQNESGEKVLLPLLYHVPVKEMIARYPVLGDVKARPVEDGEDPRDIVIDFARILIKALKAESGAAGQTA